MPSKGALNANRSRAHDCVGVVGRGRWADGLLYSLRKAACSGSCNEKVTCLSGCYAAIESLKKQA